MTHDPRLILLDPRDNVLVARVRLKAGETVETGAGPAALVKPTTTDQILTYFDGRTMWATERLGPDVVLTASVDGGMITAKLPAPSTGP